MRRSAVLTLLFLTQGRRQVVKGDLPRFFDLAGSLLPRDIDSLRPRGADAAWSVGDENCTAGDVYSLYRVTLTDETPAADWLLACELLQTALESFPAPFTAVLAEKPAVLDGLSLLLLSEHGFARFCAAKLLRAAVETPCEAWLGKAGSVFFCLQRLFVAFAMGGTVETLGEEGKLMAAMVREIVRRGGSYPRPEMTNNRELLKVTARKVETGETEDIRQFYDLDGMEEEEEGNGETVEMESESENEEENRGSENEEENRGNEDEMGQSDEASAPDSEDSVSPNPSNVPSNVPSNSSSNSSSNSNSKPRLLLRRVPNPFTLQDTLFLLGNLLSDRVLQVRETGLAIFESILRDLEPSILLQYIVFSFSLFCSFARRRCCVRS